MRWAITKLSNILARSVGESNAAPYAVQLDAPLRHERAKWVWLLTELIPGLPHKCFRYFIYGPDVKPQLMHCRAPVVPSIDV